MELSTERTIENKPLNPNLNEARKFLFLLAAPLDDAPPGDTTAETKHTFFVVGDNKSTNVRAESRYGTLSQCAGWLAEQNKCGAGVFVCIHEMDDSGQRKEANFRRIRTVVADLDAGMPEKDWPSKPTMIVTTSPGKQHVYFLVGDDMTKEQFVGIQGRLIADWRSDKQVKDVTRVLRLPGFWHRKTGIPHLVTFEVPGNEPAIYSAATLLRHFPPVLKGKPAKSTAVSTDVLPPVLSKAASAKRYTLDEVADALGYLDADDREPWVRYGLALKRDFGEPGLAVWLEWSATSRLFDHADALSKWAGFDVAQSGPDRVTSGTIIQASRRAKAEKTAVQYKDANAKGDTLVEELAGDMRHVFIRGEIQDTLSVKNVAIFLANNAIKPWHNEFDHNSALFQFQVAA